MKLTYICTECEDFEEHSKHLPHGAFCECGGHLYLKTSDNFVRSSYITDCMICTNSYSSKCLDCERSPKNV